MAGLSIRSGCGEEPLHPLQLGLGAVPECSEDVGALPGDKNLQGQLYKVGECQSPVPREMRGPGSGKPEGLASHPASMGLRGSIGMAGTVVSGSLGEAWGGSPEAHPLLLCLLDGGNLLSHHRQHLDINAVELVEAGPGPSTK